MGKNNLARKLCAGLVLLVMVMSVFVGAVSVSATDTDTDDFAIDERTTAQTAIKALDVTTDVRLQSTEPAPETQWIKTFGGTGDDCGGYGCIETFYIEDDHLPANGCKTKLCFKVVCPGNLWFDVLFEGEVCSDVKKCGGFIFEGGCPEDVLKCGFYQAPILEPTAELSGTMNLILRLKHVQSGDYKQIPVYIEIGEYVPLQASLVMDLSENMLLADGKNQTTVIARLTYSNDEPIAGETVVFSLLPAKGSLSASTGTTDANGYVKDASGEAITYTAPKAADLEPNSYGDITIEEVTIKGEVPELGVSAVTTLSFIGDDLSFAEPEMMILQTIEGGELVSGKETVVRVFVKWNSNKTSTDEAHIKVALVVGTYVSEKNAVVKKQPLYKLAERMDCKDSVNFTIPGSRVYGTTNFKVILDPDKELPEINEANNEYSTTAHFLAVEPLRILYKEIQYYSHQSPHYAIPLSQFTVKSDDFLKSIYPISELSSVNAPTPMLYETGPTLNKAHRLFVITVLFARLKTTKTWYNTWNDPNVLFCVGVVPTNYFGPDVNGVNPTTASVSTILVDRDYVGAIAHEMGHYFLGPTEEYLTNPPHGIKISGTMYQSHKDHLENIILINPDTNVYTRSLYNIMGNINYDRMWINADSYNRIKHQLQYASPQSLQSLSREGAMSSYASVSVVPEEFSNILLISGAIRKDNTVSLAPSYVLPGDSVEEGSPGDYSVECRDASGTVLSSQSFEVNLSILPAELPSEIEGYPFTLTLPYPEGVRSVVIKHGDAVLHTLTPSAHSPSISFLTPTEGEIVNGLYEITWDAYDPDDDTLGYTLLYSQTGGSSWMPLATSLTEKYYVLDSTEIPNGETLLKVVVSDGLNIAEANLDLFTVDNPLKVMATLPADGDSDVIPEAQIKAYFRDPVDENTLTSDSFFVKDSTGSIISGKITYDNEQKVATFTPDSPLKSGETYSATLTTDITDTSGRAMAKDNTWSFTVISAVVNQPPIAKFTYSPSNPVVSQMITFNAFDSYDLDGTITNYEWDFGDGNTGMGEIVTHSYTAEGDYDVKLTVTDNEGATGTITTTISCSSPSEPELTSITVSPPSVTLTTGKTQKFTATAKDQFGNEMAGIVFDWTSSDTTVGTIDATGLFTATEEGRTTITAASGTVSGTAAVIVQNDAGIIIYVNGSITEDTTWTKPNTYVVEPDVTVEEGVTLTIQPGVVVKFESCWDSINVKGTLIADGTPTDKIVFTSLKDDEYGGDTNNDGDASAPGKDDWGRIWFESTSKNSVIDNVILKYAGCPYEMGIAIDSTDVPITNSIISDIGGNGLHLVNSSSTITGNTINSTWTGIYCTDLSNPTVSNNAFTNNNWAVHLHGDCYAVLSGNTVSNNDYNGVRVEGTLSTSGTWYTNIPYIVEPDVTVEEGVALTIQPGVVVKFESCWDSINVKGTLIADGTPTDKIVFTSLKDDEYGGDTNNDGDASAPGKDDWGRIWFESTSKNSVIDNVILKYAGCPYEMGIAIDSTDVPITNSIISDIGGNGLHLVNSSSTITGNTINSTWTGIYCTDLSNPIINYNNICNNSNYGVHNADSSLTINAENNWWGDANGPLDDSDDTATGGFYNPDGLGDRVSDYVDYMPWADEPIIIMTNTAADATIALQIAVGSRPFDARWDVSGDDRVTSMDALMILQAAVGKISL